MPRGVTTPLYLAPTSVASVGAALYQYKTLLKSAGWICNRSGDATTFFSSSDGITSGASGAGGFNNVRAWVELKHPFTALTSWAASTAYTVGTRRKNGVYAYECITAGTSASSGGPSTVATSITDGPAVWKYLGYSTSAILFQVITTALTTTQCRVVYSHEGFAAGSPSANTTPDPTTSTNAMNILGSQSSSSPTGVTLFGDDLNTGAQYVQGVADSAGLHGWVFWMNTTIAANGCISALWCDPILQDYGVPVIDDDPYVFYATGVTNASADQATSVSNIQTVSAGGPITWGTVAGGTFRRAPMQVYRDQSVITAPAGTDTHPINSQYDLLSVLYARQNASGSGDGIIGVSSLFHFVAQSLTPFNVYTDVLNAQTAAYIGVGATIVAPWNGTTPTNPATYTARSANVWTIGPGGSAPVDTGDGVGPVISALAPTNASEIGRYDHVTFTLADADGLKDVIITCKFEGANDAVLVFDDAGFSGTWVGSTATPSTILEATSVNFSLRPIGGWRRAVTSLKVNGFDVFGKKEGVDV